MDQHLYLAHISPDGRPQTVYAHLQGTAELCSRFASKFGEEKRGWLLGAAHDIGKCSEAFQKRLHGGPKVDHATAGALECSRAKEDIIACCIAGHHSGLPDYGNPKTDYPGAPTYIGRIKNAISGGIPPYEWHEPLSDPGDIPSITHPYTLSMWVRMLYSCLVDADYLDTEQFMTGNLSQRSGYDSLPVLLNRLNAYIKPWFPGNNTLNQKRCSILSQCMEKANLPTGFFSLTVPTGGGKTISSLAFALKHAIAHGLDRIIYVIPYTSIIEQNAAVFRKILGDNNVVEHHSGVSYDIDDETNTSNIFQRMACENWDAPVIVTTSVQFFESIYSNRSSQCRKLHNIANSVIVFDEAQMLPTCHLLPCVGAMTSLVTQFHSTVLLCTATQPILDDLISFFKTDSKITELCPDLEENFQNFRRVNYQDGGILSDEALAGKLQTQKQVLCIVNTRKAAQALYSLLPEDGRFHLSTLMYPAHRKQVLKTIRERLAQGLSCRVISTSLIEAGVDIDFPAVWREIAGLDSIAQAAGRCNREGLRSPEKSIVTYYQSEYPVPSLQKIPIRATQEALKGGMSPAAPETMQRYFTALRSLVDGNMDQASILKTATENLLPFKTIAESFHFINQETLTVYIPLAEGGNICKPLLDGCASREDYRRAGQYSVNIYHQHFQSLLHAGDIQPLSETSAVLVNTNLYSSKTGLSMAAESGKAEFI